MPTLADKTNTSCVGLFWDFSNDRLTLDARLLKFQTIGGRSQESQTYWHDLQIPDSYTICNLRMQVERYGSASICGNSLEIKSFQDMTLLWHNSVVVILESCVAIRLTNQTVVQGYGIDQLAIQALTCVAIHDWCTWFQIQSVTSCLMIDQVFQIDIYGIVFQHFVKPANLNCEVLFKWVSNLIWIFDFYTSPERPLHQ